MEFLIAGIGIIILGALLNIISRLDALAHWIIHSTLDNHNTFNPEANKTDHCS